MTMQEALNQIAGIETKPTADRITGQAREEIVASMGAIALALDACSTAACELHAAQGHYARGLTMPLPEAAKEVDRAVERSVAVYERLREVFK